MANEDYRTLQTILQSPIGLQISHESLRVLLSSVRISVAIKDLESALYPNAKTRATLRVTGSKLRSQTIFVLGSVHASANFSSSPCTATMLGKGQLADWFPTVRSK